MRALCASVPRLLPRYRGVPLRPVVAAARGGSGGPASDKDALMKGVLAENQETVARAVDLAVAASERWEVALTYFLEPPEAADVKLAVSRLADVEARPWGGYQNAERVRMRLGRPEVLDAEGDEPKGVTLLDIAGNFMFDSANHRDFMGAILASGIERNRLGDILVQSERGAHVLTTPEMAVYLASAVTQVRNTKVTAMVAPLSTVRAPAVKADVIKTVEASLRLDAVASAGFRVSRGRMAESIEAGEVRLNWRSEGVKTSTAVKTGDVISMRGKGRVTVGDIAETKKERYLVELHRLL